MEKLHLILASRSPRRRELLTEAGFTYDAVSADVEEVHAEDTPIVQLTEENARLKARAVARQHPQALVLGADTLVSLGSRAITKPQTHAEAAEMLESLQARAHQVSTAVCLVHAQSEREKRFLVTSEVIFKPLDANGIQHYLSLINPLDKAGGYAAQEHAELIIQEIRGSYTNVVGLPMDETTAALAEFGIEPSR
jgi:septum formation protein